MHYEHAEQALRRVYANVKSADERIQQQYDRIREMQREGLDTALALKVLAVFHDARDASVQHLELILERHSCVRRMRHGSKRTGEERLGAPRCRRESDSLPRA